MVTGVSRLAAVSPGSAEGCSAVQGVLAAVCFAHAIMVLFTRAYRIPALTAMQALQSLLLGLVSCIPFMGGDTTAIATGMAYTMIGLVLADMVVSVVAIVLEHIIHIEEPTR
jgi:hypothetical protein